MRDVTDRLSSEQEKGVSASQVNVGDHVRFEYVEWMDLLVRRIGYVVAVREDSFLMTVYDLGDERNWRGFAQKYIFERVRDYQVIVKAGNR